MLVDRGFLYRNGGGWQLREGELPLPESVQGIIAARIDALQRDEKLVLQDAAVIGRGFWPAAVAAVGDLEPPDVGHLLRSLEQKELVRRLATSAVAGEHQYSFRHALVRDVAYGQIPRAERTRRHLLAATWIESLGRREDHAETLAHHYLAAVEYAEAGGEESSSFADRAQRALSEAGGRALSLSAFATAARFFNGALDLLPANAPERPLMLFSLGKALSRSASPDEGVLEDARDALLAAGDVDRAAECDVIVGELLWRSGRREQAFERMNSGIDGSKAGRRRTRRRTHSATLSRFQIAADDAEAAIELARAAMEIAEKLELDELRAHTLNDPRCRPGDRGDARGWSTSSEASRSPSARARPRHPGLLQPRRAWRRTSATCGARPSSTRRPACSPSVTAMPPGPTGSRPSASIELYWAASGTRPRSLPSGCSGRCGKAPPAGSSSTARS